MRDYDTEPSNQPVSAKSMHPVPAVKTDDDSAGAQSEAMGVDARPSKTRLKQASHELQSLGEAAVELPDDRLEGLAIAESLLDAIRQFKKTRTHEGRRRQMQYIGKLMRVHDVDPIRQAVTDLQLGRAKDSLSLHLAERWRAELLADDAAVTRWTSLHQDTDIQQLRTLIRAARKDAALVPEKRSGRAYRELFQFIKDYRLE
jgi:ribosome-associated protein